MATQPGCGSWAGPEYAGLLYPRGFPPELKLSAYAMWFDHVEVNSTYYGIPSSETVEKWAACTPDHFQFAIRLHQAISRSPQKSMMSGQLLQWLMTVMKPLFRKQKFGTFLLVLNSNFSPERHQLQELDALIGKIQPHTLAIELRHIDWVNGKARASTLDFFRARKIVWVSVDMPQIKGANLMPPVDEVTNPRLAYLRLHGRNPKYLEGKTAAEKHAYAYTEDDLKDIVKRVRRLSDKAENVRVVANNHFRDFAPQTALRLQQLLEK
jgi:uncharacterized protein YecE (DUF72 family)